MCGTTEKENIKEDGTQPAWTQGPLHTVLSVHASLRGDWLSQAASNLPSLTSTHNGTEDNSPFHLYRQRRDRPSGGLFGEHHNFVVFSVHSGHTHILILQHCNDLHRGQQKKNMAEVYTLKSQCWVLPRGLIIRMHQDGVWTRRREHNRSKGEQQNVVWTEKQRHPPLSSSWWEGSSAHEWRVNSSIILHSLHLTLPCIHSYFHKVMTILFSRVGLECGKCPLASCFWNISLPSGIWVLL